MRHPKYLIPLAWRDRLRFLWFNRLRWPMPVWAARGRGAITIGTQRLVFADIAERPHDWWAMHARRGDDEPQALAFVESHVRSGDIFFDIGAYVGQYALLAARLGCDVVAFEPDPSSRSLLARNARLNSAAIRIEALAIGSEEGALALDDTSSARSTSHPVRRAGSAEIQMTTLDRFCDETGLWPDVVKIDVEGWEVEALGPGAERVLRRLRVLLLEVHEQSIRDRGFDPERFIAGLSKGRTCIPLDGRWEGNYNLGFTR